MEIDYASLKDSLWHEMRRDLVAYVPEARDGTDLMCCACGRFLPYEAFNVEHIVPQQAVASDPVAVRSAVSKNDRCGVTLLCKKPISVKRSANGCNGWKGRHYDKCLSEIVNGSLIRVMDDRATDQHVIATICAAYLGMFAEFGYKIALMRSGVLMRQQFFVPSRCHASMPNKSRVALSQIPPAYEVGQLDFWTRPFKFSFEEVRYLQG